MRHPPEIWPGSLAAAEAQLRQSYNRRLAIALEAERAQARAQNRLPDLAGAERRVRLELGLAEGDESA